MATWAALQTLGKTGPTDELEDAPHNEFVFDKFEIVGKLG